MGRWTRRAQELRAQDVDRSTSCDNMAEVLGEAPDVSAVLAQPDVSEARASRPWWLDALLASWPDFCRKAPTRHHEYAQLRTADGRRVCIECEQPEEVELEGAMT